MSTSGWGVGGGGRGAVTRQYHQHQGTVSSPKRHLAEMQHREQVKQGLRNLLASLDPLIRASGTSANLHGMLSFLEEADEEFDHYKIVKWIKGQLRDYIQDTVMRECRAAAAGEEGLTPQKMKSAAPAILEKVMQSAELRDCLGKMRQLMSLVGDEMGRDLEEGEESTEMDAVVSEVQEKEMQALDSRRRRDSHQLLWPRREHHGGGGGRDVLNNSLFGSSFGLLLGRSDSIDSTASSLLFDGLDSSSFSSHWNGGHPGGGGVGGGGGFGFMQPQQVAKLAEKLNRFAPTEVRLEALNSLQMIQLGDVCTPSQQWESIREGLQAALLDPNQSISSFALKIHSKILSSNVSPFATKEAHTSLVTTVTNLYKDRTRAHSIPTVSSGVSFKKKTHYSLLQVIKTLAESNMGLPKIWTRYPEKIVNDIVNNMITLMTVSGTNRKLLYPLSILAMVDPKANWARRWCHGGLGRKLLINNFKNADGLMSTLTATLVSALETRTPEEWILVRSAFRRSAGARSNSAKGGNINAHLVDYAAFCQAAHVVTLLLRFKSASGLFQQGGAASGCLRSMIGFAVTGHHLPPQHQQALRGPARLVADCLLDLLSSSSHARSVLVSSPHLTVQLMTPIRLWMETKGSRSKTLGQVHLQACQILTCLLNNASGGIEISEVQTLNEDGDALEILTDFCCRALDRHQDLDHATKMAVASLAESVLTSTTVSVARPNFEKLVDVLSEVMAEMKDMAESSVPEDKPEEVAETNEQKVFERLRQALSCIAFSSPMGMVYVSKDIEVLELIMKGQWSKLSKQPSFALIAFASNGRKLLCKERFVDRWLMTMLETFSLEGDNKHWRPSPREIETKMLQVTTLFSQLLVIPGFLKALTMKHDSQASNCGSNCSKTLRDLLLFRDSPFTNYSETESVFALKLHSSILLGSPNGLVHLEGSHGITKILKEQLGQPGSPLDREGLYLSHITESIMAPDGSLCSLSNHIKDPFEELPVVVGKYEPKKDNLQAKGQVAKFVAFIKENKLGLASSDPKSVISKWTDQASEMLIDCLKDPNGSVQLPKDLLLHELLTPIMQQQSWSQPALPRNMVEVSDKKEPNEHALCIDMLVNLGKKNNLLDDALTDIVKRKAELLELTTLSSLSRTPGTERDEVASRFDWFSGMCYLMCGCSLENARSLLTRLNNSDLDFVPFLWPQRRVSSENDPFSSPILLISHWAERMLKLHVPSVYSCLRFEGVSISLVLCTWLDRCFLGVLPLWSETCHFILLQVLMGPDYSVYFCVSILKHMQDQILSIASKQADGKGRYLVETLFACSDGLLSGFRAGDYVDFMQKMAQDHGKRIREDFKAMIS